jgi:hypothetical protein
MTTIPVPRGVPAAVGEYFARLRALQVGVEDGWLEFVAGDNRACQYRVDIPAADPLPGADAPMAARRLGRDAYWWVLGIGDGHGHGDLVLQQPVVPVLLDVREAALAIGQAGDHRLWKVRLDDVRRRVGSGEWTVFWPGGKRRVAKLEVLATATGDPAVQDQWEQMRRMWPVGQPLDATTGLDEPRPAAERVRQPLAERRMMALTRVSDAGLIRYLWIDRDRDVYAASVTVGDTTVIRELVGDTVTPWLRGIVDRAGRSDLITGLE